MLDLYLIPSGHEAIIMQAQTSATSYSKEGMYVTCELFGGGWVTEPWLHYQGHNKVG